MFSTPFRFRISSICVSVMSPPCCFTSPRISSSNTAPPAVCATVIQACPRYVYLVWRKKNHRTMPIIIKWHITMPSTTKKPHACIGRLTILKSARCTTERASNSGSLR
ncbi:uncharacterized protein HMPREF1120_05046 [Exophiala dermatitidis NIH/UT8656]|uniref:Uncharacterized protein n=1 Tax=Exophiala dermatitidis (strain ATCC 34100 / CBS 525.76 / NIH/UT8656) TaxID=858893 RepID=H6BZC7_EXODN|nr:uncharacterized protein HMPREF1120_05046 [Exophiala dermatitidis NIH/UT8656]EHY56990.1 hypothetical protein HMPREF1120_05046 [Exophiala dermatitidis NIH/UT8656]